MNIDLVKEMAFKLDETKRVGTVRVDWYDGRLCNQWNPTNLLTELKKARKLT